MSMERGGMNYQDLAVGTTNIVTKQSRFYGFTMQGDGTNAGTLVAKDGVAGNVLARGAVSTTLVSYALLLNALPVIMTSASEVDPGTSAGKAGATLSVVIAGGATTATVYFQ